MVTPPPATNRSPTATSPITTCNIYLLQILSEWLIELEQIEYLLSILGQYFESTKMSTASVKLIEYFRMCLTGFGDMQAHFQTNTVLFQV